MTAGAAGRRQVTDADTMQQELAARMTAAFASGDAVQVRASLRASRRPPVPVPVERVENRCITDSGLGVRIYHPLGADGSAEGLPVLIYFHGGGFVLCDLDSHDSCCRRLANGAGAVVVSVDYRLAPEFPFPAALDDAWVATEWVARNVRELGGDPARLVLAGDSAGGNLAAVVAMIARDRGGPSIAFQVLIYPVVDQRRKSSVESPHTASGVLTAEHMQWFTEQYLGPDGDRTNVLASPILADLAGLPPAHVVTGEEDPLCEEDEEFARKLNAAGVPASVRRYDRMFHGFFNLADHLPVAEQATDDVCAVLRTVLRGEPRWS